MKEPANNDNAMPRQGCGAGDSGTGLPENTSASAGEPSGLPPVFPEAPSPRPAKVRRPVRWAVLGIAAVVVLFLGLGAALQIAKLAQRTSDRIKLRWAAAANLAAHGIPPRDRQAKPGQVDLSAFYNAPLTNSVASGEKGNDLAEVPQGLQTMAGVEFDVRGVVQLSASGLRGTERDIYPASVNDIPINRKVARLHFLHGAVWHEALRVNVGSYVLHYADGQARELPLVYGVNIEDFWRYETHQDQMTNTVVAWAGENADIRRFKGTIGILKMVQDNPLPEVEIKSIEFTSAMSKSAPFLIAITVEPVTPKAEENRPIKSE